jgi:hypothetical protein
VLISFHHMRSDIGTLTRLQTLNRGLEHEMEGVLNTANLWAPRLKILIVVHLVTWFSLHISYKWGMQATSALSQLKISAEIEYKVAKNIKRPHFLSVLEITLLVYLVLARLLESCCNQCIRLY